MLSTNEVLANWDKENAALDYDCDNIDPKAIELLLKLSDYFSTWRFNKFPISYVKECLKIWIKDQQEIDNIKFFNYFSGIWEQQTGKLFLDYLEWLDPFTSSDDWNHIKKYKDKWLQIFGRCDYFTQNFYRFIALPNWKARIDEWIEMFSSYLVYWQDSTSKWKGSLQVFFFDKIFKEFNYLDRELTQDEHRGLSELAASFDPNGHKIKLYEHYGENSLTKSGIFDNFIIWNK